MGGMSLSIRQTGASPVTASLGQYIGAEFFARFDSQLGSGGLYYVENTVKSFAEIVVSISGVEPTPTGLGISADDAPTLVQGSGPVPHPGYSGTDHTVAITWDANGATGDRVVWAGWADVNNYLLLHFVSGVLRLESVVVGVSKGFVAVAGVDDGNAHTALIYWDEAEGTLTLRVDDIPVTGVELWTSPNAGVQNALGSSGAYDQGTQTMSELGTGSSSGYPRFGFSLLQTGLTYEVAGRLEGHLNGIGVRMATFGSTAYIDIDSVTGLFGGTEEAEAGILQILTPGNQGPWSTHIAEISVKQSSARTGLTLPSGIVSIDIGHHQGTGQINGTVIELASANGDFRDIW